MNVHIQLDSQEELRMLFEALQALPFSEKLKVSVATPQDFVPSRVKEVVAELIPGAELILYGSRARGDNRKYSDWDFMVVAPTAVDDDLQYKVEERLYEIEIGQSVEIQLMYTTRQSFEANGHRPLYSNIGDEGIRI